MEGAGIALAVIPLVVEIFKSYRTVRDRFRAFAHADDVLRELMLIYHLAMDSFRNECELLLSNAVYDNEILAAMMVDPEHAAWQDPQLEPRLCAFLDSNNETFRRTFIWIKDRLNNAERELERLYDEPGTEETRGFLRGAKDAKLAFTISRKESSDRVLLDEIDEWLKKIRRLRKQRSYESVPSDKNAVLQQSLPVMSEESKPVTNMLQGLRSELEQLILAHRIAIATLQYHSSPWLGEDWNLEDIFHFDAWAHQDHDSFEKRSKSLHFNARFLATTTSSLRQAEKAEKEEKFRLHEVIGKTNIPLAKLGVALLQICYKTDKYNVNSSGQHAIITARETLEYPPRPPSYLGRQWLDMAQKCVDCDFSVGTNLDSVALQAAVYHQIICVLDSKIVPLKGFMNEIAEPIV
ncbi:uncharacterized protein J4E92_010797 [Alternaria infectoria]|uniref:uncharacterized protein n=1 Tax=Alternaria infectoria TaxID=45303 RepID=UPI0022206D21|nr:uncharacterized protein J4E92_010797 [Alternaria infectoria]KAI4908604.1 hypothetical protein J4E92_010797 [Alternaria infectoria]